MIRKIWIVFLLIAFTVGIYHCGEEKKPEPPPPPVEEPKPEPKPKPKPKVATPKEPEKEPDSPKNLPRAFWNPNTQMWEKYDF